MIFIKEEDKQEYGFTNGCASCGTCDLDKDIKEIGIFIDRGKGTVINLCKECREELKSIL
ncbi:hypothetical protein FMM80_00620 [Schaedlerella arabinosiphila]|uniref:Uncharacterized protein n=1 Tax=Schaedlerella arabinosiphila TaxID=2044587 RepID=A0A9X5C722_9FIRM|nr:hypothetical protein [Schaedlerella arabinosiphila]KAI4438921.1 hypothetical protein C824_001401 [Schaedlerella arabinosiphila]NDO67317.1 hypothetical protein [Schaedlerella arabinosiphila]